MFLDRVNGLNTAGVSDIRMNRRPNTLPCDYCGRDFKDGEVAYRLAKGKVSFSVPSFVPDTASIFFHEECWNKVARESRKGLRRENARHDAG